MYNLSRVSGSHKHCYQALDRHKLFHQSQESSKDYSRLNQEMDKNSLVLGMIRPELDSSNLELYKDCSMSRKVRCRYLLVMCNLIREYSRGMCMFLRESSRKVNNK